MSITTKRAISLLKEATEQLEAADSKAGPSGLSEDDVLWVVNDHGELGVKIGSDLFWLYKGHSIRQQFADTSDPRGIKKYRQVGKREFGETCKPASWPRNPDGDEWHDLPQASGEEAQPPAELDHVREWVRTYLSHLTPEQHEDAVKHFSRPSITLRDNGYYSFSSGGWLTVAHVSNRVEN